VTPPGDQVYVDAPLEVRVTELPEQAVSVEAATVKVGVVPTNMFIVLVAVHPAAFAPVTVYWVVTVGDTTTVFPVNAPGFQVYVAAPVLVSVALPPEHNTVGLLVAVTVGLVLTTRLIVCVVLHPLLFLVSVYVVVTVGVTVMDDVVAPPGIHE
jgi:hypothetical protein